jgi:hypothetical protein
MKSTLRPKVSFKSETSKIKGGSEASSRLLRVERILSHAKEENKNNPTKGVLWYLVFCLARSAAMILASLLFSLNNQPGVPGNNLLPF